MTYSSEFNRHESGFGVLHKVGQGVWTFVAPFMFMGKVPLQNRSIIIHAPHLSALVIINPSELTAEIAAAIHALEAETSSTVKYLLSPGDWHYMFAGLHLKEFPQSTFYVPPGRIPRQNVDFPFSLMDIEVDNPFPELAPSLVPINIKGLSDFSDQTLPRYELAFYLPTIHAITSGDVFSYYSNENMSEHQKAVGMIPDILDFHLMRAKTIKNAAEVAKSIELVLTFDFDRYISIHGNPGNFQESRSKQDLQKLLDWVKSL